jgi:hypothetical protein
MLRTLQTRLAIAAVLREHASYQHIAETLHVSPKMTATVRRLLDDRRPTKTSRPRGRPTKMFPPRIAAIRNKTLESPS